VGKEHDLNIRETERFVLVNSMDFWDVRKITILFEGDKKAEKISGKSQW